MLSGGRGGLGNNHFKSSTNQAPRYAQPGESGKEEWKILELKVLADVGLVGFQIQENLLYFQVLSAARPEIANYPFTTIIPNLGIVAHRAHQSFIMADIPGIIHGAHVGKGLGHRFLRHIERNSVLLLMISVDSNSIIEEYNILINELKQYNPELLDKEKMLALTKSDLLDDELKNELKKEIPAGINSVFISSVAQIGLIELKDEIWKLIHNESN